MPRPTARPSSRRKNVLTPLERAAVSIAAQTAATEQESLAPLFANLGAAVSSGSLPPKLQQAIAQVLAQQTSLDQNLDGGDIKTAFQKSGIFLEASLAIGFGAVVAASPDLKAALIVLRQTLQSALGAANAGRRRRRRRACDAECRADLVPLRRPGSTSRKSCCRRRGCRSPTISPMPRTPAAARVRAALNAGPTRRRHAEPAAGSAAGTRQSRARGRRCRRTLAATT